MRILRTAMVTALVGACLMGLQGGPAVAAVAPSTGPSVDVPPGVTAGVVVFDRDTGQVTEQLNPDMQFRSASVVKLLITLDLLWERTPDQLSAADRQRVEVMLRSSDDAAASHFWGANGQGEIVRRMISRLGLKNTAPPPSNYPGYWGYTAFTAADTVTIYRYILDTAPAAVRDFMLGLLHGATRCGTDGFDQYFGIPSVFAKPWAVKQGWSGFAISGGCASSTGSEASAPVSPRAVDLVSEALHATGLVGAGDRTIVAVYTLHPDGTRYGTAYSKVNTLVRSLNIPGGSALQGTTFGTWGNGVRVRAGATTQSAVLGTLPSGVEVLVGCQKRGERVSVPPYENDWWAYLPAYDGYMTNIYVSSPDNKLPGVPDC